VQKRAHTAIREEDLPAVEREAALPRIDFLQDYLELLILFGFVSLVGGWY
jgi:hypothetical protein